MTRESFSYLRILILMGICLVYNKVPKFPHFQWNYLCLLTFTKNSLSLLSFLPLLTPFSILSPLLPQFYVLFSK